MGYGSRKAWSPIPAPAAWWNAKGGGQAVSGQNKSQPWKCVGTDGCGYAWNKPHHRHCGMCNLHWDFGQRLASGKASATPLAAEGGKPGEAQPYTAASAGGSLATDGSKPACATATAARLSQIDTLRKELLGISTILGLEHADVVSRTKSLASLEEEQKLSLPIPPVDTLRTRNLARQRANAVQQAKCDKKLLYTEAKLASAQKEHDDIVAWNKVLESELQEIKDEKDHLWNKPSESDPDQTYDGDEGQDDDWESLFTEVTDKSDCLSGDTLAQFENFKKMRAILQKLAKSVRTDRLSSKQSTPEVEHVDDEETPGEASASQASQAEGKTTGVTRPGEGADAGDASRRKTDGAFGKPEQKKK